MDTLDKIVNDNREQFYSEMPENGHFERFTEKLNRRTTAKRLTFNKSWYMVAATLLILLVSSVVLIKNQNNKTDLKIANTLPAEYREISNYYGSIVNNKYDKVKALDKVSSDKKLLKKLSSELNELNESQSEILEDAKKNPNDPMVMNAYMNLFKCKIELIDRTILNYNLSTNNKKYIQV